MDSIVSAQYYESRLSPDAEQVDYLFALQRSAAVVAYERAAAYEQRSGMRAESWQRILRLLETWADGKSLTSVLVPTVWFEYDGVSGAQHETRVPSISVCITPTYRIAQRHQTQGSLNLRLPHEVLGLLGVEVDRQAVTTLSSVFSELPLEARWIHLSYMLGRTPRAIKLYGVLRRGELLDYLKRIGWAGERSAIELALAELYPAEVLGEELFLDLDLDNFQDKTRCSLGLAVAQQHLLRGPDPDPSRNQILKLWTAAGLCDPLKVASVKAWPSTAAHLPAAPLQREARFLDLKLVWRAETGFLAKAYVGRQRARGLF